VVTDATKKLREPVAYILLAFAGLVALASLIRLFVGSAGFTNAAALVRGSLTPPALTGLVLLAALVAAVWLVNEAGERTHNARLVTVAALAITGVLALIVLIGAFATFSETSTAGLKFTSFLLALAGLAVYGAAGLYIVKTFQSLPAPVRAPKAGPQGQFAGQGQYGAPAAQGGQFGQQGGQYGQQGAQSQYGQYGQQGAQQGQYGQNEQGQFGAYGAGAAGAAAGAAGGYAAAQAGEQQWPQEQNWNQGEQQSWPVNEAEPAVPQSDALAGQPAEQAWSAEGQAAEPTQQWSPEGQQQQWAGQEQGQQWPQEGQQQWGGADAGQQWPAQEQYAQPAQQEWPAQEAAQPEAGQPAAAPQAEGWSQQGWQQEGQAWQAEEPAAPAAEQPAEAAPEVPDETRVEPRVSEDAKDEDGQPQQGQPGQQGWWSQPS